MTFTKVRPATPENKANSQNIERTLKIRSEPREYKSYMQINYTQRFGLNETVKT